MLLISFLNSIDLSSFFIPTQAPIYTLSSNKVRGTISSGNNLGSSRLGNCLTSFDKRRCFSGADRFIPQRRHQNLDAMNYNHTKVPLLGQREEHDMLDPTKHLMDKSWRKVALKNAMIRANVIPGLEEERVYNFADRENRHPTAKVVGPETWFDIPGNSKARSRPLIGRRKFIIKVRPSARTWPTTETLDWSARNLIAVAVDGPTDSYVSVFDAGTGNIGTITQPLIKLAEHLHGILSIKWNHRGDRIAVVTERSELRVYSMEKMIWMKKCSCDEVGADCTVSIVAWTHSDDAVVICCDKNRISSYTYAGELTQSFLALPMDHYTDFVSCMAFSMNDRYYAYKTFGFARVFTWPGFAQVVSVDLRWSAEDPHLCSIMSLAWHPWDMNILCIGVHPFISLYDIQRAKVLCWKRAVPGLFADEIVWNKLSGELVVKFNHTEGNQSRSTIAVLSSFNRIVDIVYNGFSVSGLIWNPDDTELCTARRCHVNVWNFFGNETRKWREAHEESEVSKKKSYLLARRRNIFTDQTRHFEHYNIR